MGRHDEDQAPAIEYFKLGKGPYYVLVRPYHLCSLEVGKTLRRVLGGGVLLNNSISPTLGVAAVMKRPMRRGETIERGIGGYSVRGEAVKIVDQPEHLPIGLLRNSVLRRDVAPGQILTFDDVELVPSRVLDIVLQERQSLVPMAPVACLEPAALAS